MAPTFSGKILHCNILSHPLHKTIHHALLPRLVEADGQLVAVDGGDVAVAELQVKNAVAGFEAGGGPG